MGWFGVNPLDGDDGMDLRGFVFDIIGVKYDDYNMLHTCSEVGLMLDENQDILYDWIRDYNWDKHSNPGFIQEVYIQALMQIFLDYDVQISERGKKDAILFIENDEWAKEDKERAKAMQRLLKQVKES